MLIEVNDFTQRILSICSSTGTTASSDWTLIRPRTVPNGHTIVSIWSIDQSIQELPPLSYLRIYFFRE